MNKKWRFPVRELKVKIGRHCFKEQRAHYFFLLLRKKYYDVCRLNCKQRTYGKMICVMFLKAAFVLPV